MTIQPDDFVLCPDQGRYRLIRFDLDPDRPRHGSGLVARLDQQKNILHINRELYDALSSYQQDRVIKTRLESVFQYGEKLAVEGCDWRS